MLLNFDASMGKNKKILVLSSTSSPTPGSYYSWLLAVILVLSSNSSPASPWGPAEVREETSERGAK